MKRHLDHSFLCKS